MLNDWHKLPGGKDLKMHGWLNEWVEIMMCGESVKQAGVELFQTKLMKR